MKKSRYFLLLGLCALLVSAFSCSLFSAKNNKVYKVNAASNTYIVIGDHQGSWNYNDDRFAMTQKDGQYEFKDIHWTTGQSWRITWAGEWGTYAGWSTLQNKENFEAAEKDNNIKSTRDWYYDIYYKNNDDNKIYIADAAYTVTLNKNGGSISSGDDITGYSYGETKYLPILSKEGFEFRGWYDNPSFSGYSIEEISESDHGNKTFYAKFATAQVALTYELSGGTLTAGVPAGTYDYNTTITQPSATRYGYNLIGWVNDVGDAVTFPFNLVESTELVAKWEPSVYYTISFKVNNSNYGSVSPSSVSVPIGAVVAIDNNEIYFNETKVVATSAPPTTTTQYNFIGWEGVEHGTVIASDKTVTANFEEGDRLYSLNWELYGGTASGGTPAGKYMYNTEVDAPTVEKAGKYFDGWYDNPEFTGDCYDFPYTLTRDITFYIKWGDALTLTIINSDERGGQKVFSDLKYDSYQQFPTIESIFGNNFHEPFGRYYVGLKVNPSDTSEIPKKEFRITSNMTLYACYAFYDANYYQYSFDGTNYLPFQTMRDAGADETSIIKVYFNGGLTVVAGSQLYLKANNNVISYTPETANTNIGSDGKVKVSSKNAFLDLKLSKDGTYKVHISGTPESNTFFISIDKFLTKLNKSTTADEYYIQGITINNGQIVEAYYNQYYSCSLDSAVDSTYFEVNSDNKIVCKKNGSYDVYLKNTGSENYNMYYLAPHGLTDATNYAKHFISEISKICDTTKSGGDILPLANEWSNEKTLFQNLKDDATRAWLTNALPVESGNDLEKFGALYDYIFIKYGSKVGDNFAKRNVTPSNSSQSRFLFNGEYSDAWIVIVAFSFVGLASISIFIHRKKNSI